MLNFSVENINKISKQTKMKYSYNLLFLLCPTLQRGLIAVQYMSKNLQTLTSINQKFISIIETVKHKKIMLKFLLTFTLFEIIIHHHWHHTSFK